MARAKNNRTLIITDEDRITYSKDIIKQDDLGKLQSFVDTTINADIYETLKYLPDNFANLIIVDPPYNISKNFNGLKFNEMSNKEYEDYLESWFVSLCDKLKDNGTLYMCGDWKCSCQMLNVISKKLTVLNRITWKRDKGRGAKRNWKNNMEDIWFAVKNPKDYYFNVDTVKVRKEVIAPYKDNGKPKDWTEDEDGNKFRMTHPSNIWTDMVVPFWSMAENTEHPTQKPEKLIERLILASSKEGDVILDPFVGSGTTSVVAKRLNRRYCGIEINEEYCLMTEKRIKNLI